MRPPFYASKLGVIVISCAALWAITIVSVIELDGVERVEAHVRHQFARLFGHRHSSDPRIAPTAQPAEPA